MLCPRWDSNCIPGLTKARNPQKHPESAAIRRLYHPIRGQRVLTLSTLTFAHILRPSISVGGVAWFEHVTVPPAGDDGVGLACGQRVWVRVWGVGQVRGGQVTGGGIEGFSVGECDRGSCRSERGQPHPTVEVLS